MCGVFVMLQFYHTQHTGLRPEPKPEPKSSACVELHLGEVVRVVREVFFFVLLAVPNLAVAGVVIAGEVRIGFDCLVRAVELTVAVASFVAAAREVLATSSLSLHVAGVESKEVDVRGAESALRASSRGGEVERSVRHVSMLSRRELKTKESFGPSSAASACPPGRAGGATKGA